MRTSLTCSVRPLVAAWILVLPLAASVGCGKRPEPPSADQPKTDTVGQPGEAPAVGGSGGSTGAEPTGAPADPPDEKAKVYLEEEWGAARRLEAKGGKVDWPDKNLHITKIAFVGSDFQDAALATLKDEDLADLRKLPYLKELVLKADRFRGLKPNQITSAAFAHLAGLSRLESLDVSGLAIDDDACEHIGKLTALRVLNLADTRVSDDGLNQLKKLAQLNSLSLAGTRVSGEGLGALADTVKNLRWLNLMGTKLTTADLAGVGKFTSLSELYLPDAELPKGSHPNPVYAHYAPPASPSNEPYKPIPADKMNYVDGLKHLSGLVNLKSVAMTRVFGEVPEGAEVSGTPLVEEGPIERGKILMRLDSYRTGGGTGKETATRKEAFLKFYRKDHKSGLWSHQVLRNEPPFRIPFFDDQKHGSLLAHIRGYKNVATLDLSSCLLADEDLKHLAGFANLKRLDLSGQYITKAGLAHLKGLPLVYLNLRGCAIGDEDLDAVREIKTLKDVVLSQTRVTEKGADTFRRGKLEAVYDPKQKRPEWCDVNWREFVDAATK